MTDDSPAVIQFNSDGYELPVLSGESAVNVPAILSGGVDENNEAQPLAVDTTGKSLNKEQNKLVPFEYDFIEMSYIAPEFKLVDTMTYRQGGPTGTIVAAVAFAYDANDNIISMTRT